jgi:hypothetical protein
MGQKVLVVFWQFFQLGITEDRAILADVETTDVTPTAFSDTTFHPPLQRGEDALVRESKGHQFRKGKFDHDGGAANDRIRIL